VLYRLRDEASPLPVRALPRRSPLVQERDFKKEESVIA
jgi:hypothetical protein